MNRQTLFDRMKKLLIISTFLHALSAHGQTAYQANELRQKILSADSIILISHNLTGEFLPKEVESINSNTQQKSVRADSPTLLIDGRLNREIVSELVLLNETDKQTLIKILFGNPHQTQWTPLTCDEPRHSIIIYTGNTVSFVDFCFTCKRVHISDDIDLKKIFIDDHKWKLMENFFKSKGVTKVFNEQEQ